jgi:S-phase kinase-associated protein 1
MVENTKQLKFISCDGHSFMVSEKLMDRSSIIKAMIDDGTANDDIPLPLITKVTFERVIKYLEHVEEGNPIPEIEKPIRSNDLKDVTTEFYANFIDLSDDEV